LAALAAAADEHLTEHLNGDSTDAIITSGVSAAHKKLLPVSGETIGLNLYSVIDCSRAIRQVDRSTIDDTNTAE
jgi:hypothetical protein